MNPNSDIFVCSLITCLFAGLGWRTWVMISNHMACNRSTSLPIPSLSKFKELCYRRDRIRAVANKDIICKKCNRNLSEGTDLKVTTIEREIPIEIKSIFRKRIKIDMYLDAYVCPQCNEVYYSNPYPGIDGIQTLDKYKIKIPGDISMEEAYVRIKYESEKINKGE